MRLHGIYLFSGTVIGVHKRNTRLLVSDGADATGTVLRYATAEEVTPDKLMREPRSVAEHRAIPRILTPFGMGRVYKPTPYPRTDGRDPLIGRYSGRPKGILSNKANATKLRKAKRQNEKHLKELYSQYWDLS